MYAARIQPSQQRLCPQMRPAEKELIATTRDLALVSYLFCAHEAIHAQTAAERAIHGIHN